MVSAPEAVKDLTLRDDGICRGVLHYQIIARRQDFEAPVPHGVAVCGLRLRPTGCSAFRPNSMGILIRQEHSACFLRPPWVPLMSGTPVQCRPFHPRFPNHTNGHLFKIPILGMSTPLTRKCGKDYEGTSLQACDRPWLPTRGSGPAEYN